MNRNVPQSQSEVGGHVFRDINPGLVGIALHALAPHLPSGIFDQKICGTHVCASPAIKSQE